MDEHRVRENLLRTCALWQRHCTVKYAVDRTKNIELKNFSTKTIKNPEDFDERKMQWKASPRKKSPTCLTNRFTRLPVSHALTRSATQSVGRPLSRSVGRLISRSVSLFVKENSARVKREHYTNLNSRIQPKKAEQPVPLHHRIFLTCCVKNLLFPR